MQLLKIIFIGVLILTGATACKKDAASKQQLSGAYLHDFKKWIAADSISVPLDSISFFGQPASFEVINSSELKDTDESS